MSDQPFAFLAPRPLPPARTVRVEYLGFQDVEAHREFRFRVYGPDGPTEMRMRIATAAFDARRIRRQDGPDLCYQKLLRAIADGLTAHPDVSTIEDVDLLRYTDDHTVVVKRRPRTPASPATATAVPRSQPQYRPRTPAAPPLQIAAAPVDTTDVAPALEEGQRVKHAVFGLGVTTAATTDRTVVTFDRDGSRSFVTSMLEVEVLSGPHTWDSSPRGVNRPCGPGSRTSSPA